MGLHSAQQCGRTGGTRTHDTCSVRASHLPARAPPACLARILNVKCKLSRSPLTRADCTLEQRGHTTVACRCHAAPLPCGGAMTVSGRRRRGAAVPSTNGASTNGAVHRGRAPASGRRMDGGWRPSSAAVLVMVAALATLPRCRGAAQPATDPCSVHPCQNGGACTSGLSRGQYSCTCRQGFEGAACGQRQTRAHISAGLEGQSAALRAVMVADGVVAETFAPTHPTARVDADEVPFPSPIYLSTPPFWLEFCLCAPYPFHKHNKDGGVGAGPRAPDEHRQLHGTLRAAECGGVTASHSQRAAERHVTQRRHAPRRVPGKRGASICVR